MESAEDDGVILDEPWRNWDQNPATRLQRRGGSGHSDFQEVALDCHVTQLRHV